MAVEHSHGLTVDERARLEACPSCWLGALRLLQPGRGGYRDRGGLGREFHRARRIRAGLDRRGLKRPCHPLAVPPPPARKSGATSAEAHRAVLLRAGGLRHVRVRARPAHRHGPRTFHRRNRARGSVAGSHAIPVLGATSNRAGTALGKCCGGLETDPDVHLSVGGTPRRLGPQLHTRMGMGGPPSRSRHRWRRSEGGP